MSDLVKRLNMAYERTHDERFKLAAAEIERLRAVEAEFAAFKAAEDIEWMRSATIDRLQATEARLAEAVEVMRTIVGTLDDPTGGQHVADMRSASATARAFIAKMESKP